MKLLEALQIANAPSEGVPFVALLACSATPLHLETAVKAHLRLALPGRAVSTRTGLYGDLAGTIESVAEGTDLVLVALEWSDLDPRLGWRGMGAPVANVGDVESTASARLSRIAAGIEAAARRCPVALTLPTLPPAPIFHTPPAEMHRGEARLRELLYAFAAATSAAVARTDALVPAAGHDLRGELLTGFPYAFAHADALAACLVRVGLPPPPKKGLVTDLDETLWGGILGDDGPDAISWDLDHRTQFHALYQQLLNSLAGSGVLVGVASKNDPELVTRAFARQDLLLKPAVAFPVEAHWGPKAGSMVRILEAWNIGADSVVFVDDNPLELAQMKAVYPAVACIEFRKDDPALLVQLRELFGKRTVGAEDGLRAASLRESRALREASGDAATLDDLLAGAAARVTFRWGKEPLDPRALELVNKTNQFNLNGARYLEGEWRTYLSDPAARLLLVEYEDRFGRLGKIAVLAGREAGGRLDLDVWVMSCRAFSRRIEHQCLKLLLERWSTVRLRYAVTERNQPVRDFLAQVSPDSLEIARAAFAERCPPLYHERESVDG